MDTFNKYVYVGNITNDERGDWESMIDDAFDVAVEDAIGRRYDYADETTMAKMYTLARALMWDALNRISNGVNAVFVVKTPTASPFTANRPFTKQKYLNLLQTAFADFISRKCTIAAVNAIKYENNDDGEGIIVGERSKTITINSGSVTSDSAGTSTGSTRQKFNNSTSTNTTGTADFSERSDNTSTAATTTNNNSAEMSVPREYDGDLSAWVKSVTKYNSAIATIFASVDAFFIPYEEVNPWEVISFYDLADE